MDTPTLTIVPETPPLRADAHGVVRVGGMRITLDTIVYAFSDGASAEQIVDDYSSLSLADVYATIAYYLRHKEAVDAYLRERERQAAAIQAEHEARFPQHGIRERLLARLAAQERVAGAASAR